MWHTLLKQGRIICEEIPRVLFHSWRHIVKRLSIPMLNFSLLALPLSVSFVFFLKDVLSVLRQGQRLPPSKRTLGPAFSPLCLTWLEWRKGQGLIGQLLCWCFERPYLASHDALESWKQEWFSQRGLDMARRFSPAISRSPCLLWRDMRRPGVMLLLCLLF